MDVADWLRALGLEQYEASFRQNDVNADLLPNLTAEDLKDLGIAMVGHRRRLLDAIAELRIKAIPTADPVQMTQGPARGPHSPESNAERHTTIEMTETNEEAVVSKTARVTEEVSLRKQATDRVETVKDTVRREEVEVEQVPGTAIPPRSTP